MQGTLAERACCVEGDRERDRGDSRPRQTGSPPSAGQNVAQVPIPRRCEHIPFKWFTFWWRSFSCWGNQDLMFAHAVMNIYWWISIKSCAWGCEDTVQEASGGINEILHRWAPLQSTFCSFIGLLLPTWWAKSFSKTAVKQYVPLDTYHYLQVVLQACWLLSSHFFK